LSSEKLNLLDFLWILQNENFSCPQASRQTIEASIENVVILIYGEFQTLPEET